MFEFIGEFLNPGSIGTIDISKAERENINMPILLVRTGISLGVIGLCFIAFVGGFSNIMSVLIFIGAMTGYCFIGFLVEPKPDYSNIGWLGGLMDHPFRISDDINRMMIFFMIVLWPGKMIARTFMAWIFYFFVIKE